MHQYAYLGTGKSIHSSGQMEHFKLDICDRSKNVGGKQRMLTLEGQVIPFHTRGGLIYMDMTPPSDEEMENLTHVVITADMDWDPSVLDNEHDGQLLDEDEPYHDPIFDDHGLYIDKPNPRSVIHALLSHDDGYETPDDSEEEQFFDCIEHETSEPSETIHYIQDHEISASPKATRKSDWDWTSIRPKLGFAPLSVIKQTISRTTQYYRETFHRTPMRDHLRTRFPAANVRRRHESVATDWIYSF